MSLKPFPSGFSCTTPCVFIRLKAMHCVSALCSRQSVTIKPAIQLLLQVHEPRRGPDAPPRLETCLDVQLCLSMFRYSECRIALFRHRSGFTSKTLPHVHQPYVVKVSPTPRHVLRRAATRNLRISRFSNRRIFKPLNAMSCGLLCRHRCRSTTKTVQPSPISSPVI